VIELMPLTYNSGAKIIIRGGTYQDLSGNGIAITNNGTTIVNDDLGRVNRSFQADGDSQNISLGTIGDDFMTGANGKFTVIFSVKELSVKTAGTIWAKQTNTTGLRGYFLQLVNGTIQFNAYNAGAPGSANDYLRLSFATETGINTRYVIGMTYDNTLAEASKLKLYVNRVLTNGVGVITGTFTGIGSTTQNMVLFSRSSNSQWFNGNIGFFYLNPKVLSDETVGKISSEIMNGAV